MTTTAEVLVDLIVDALKGSTAAGQSVYAFRAWPVKMAANNPQIIIDLPEELKEGLGPNGPGQFNTTASITVRAFIGANSSDPRGDGGEVAVRLGLLTIRRQIEVAVINAGPIMAVIQQIKAVHTKMERGEDDSGLGLGQAAIRFDFEFYQGAEDFAPIDQVTLTTAHVDAALADPAGVDVSLDIPLI